MDTKHGSFNYHDYISTVFGDELEALTEPYRLLVVESFNRICPPYFWYVTAALGGVNHPRACRSVGGLVKHTKLAVWWALRLIKFNGQILDEQRQEIIAAVLLHDMCKFQKPEGVEGQYTDGIPVKSHGHWAAWAMWRLWAPCGATSRWKGLIPAKSFKRIVYAVAWHMGQWSEGAPVNLSQCDAFGRTVYDVVSMADYLAASKVDKALAQLQDTGRIEYEERW